MGKSYIEKIWSKDTVLQIYLLRFLYNSTEGMHIENLIKKLSVSRRTIYRLVGGLQELIKEEPCEIGISDQGVYRFIGNKIDYYITRGKIIDQEIILILAKKLLVKKTVNIPEFCTMVFFSESTFKRYLRKVNELLEPMELKLRVKKDEVYIEGEENIIRYSLYSLFWRSYHGVVWPFDQIEENELDIFISQFSFDKLPISQGKLKQFSYFLAINILRSKSGNKIDRGCLPRYTHSLIYSAPLFPDFFKALNSTFDLELQEIEFIFLYLYTFPGSFRYLQNISKILEILEKEGKKTYKSIRHFLFFVKERHPNFKINSEEKFLFIAHIISSRIFVDLFHGIYFNSSSLLIFQYTKKHFPNLLPSIEKGIEEFETELSSSAFRGLVLRYAQAYVTEFPPQDFEPQISILLITDLPVYLDVVMKRRLVSILSYKFNIVWLTQEQNIMPDILLSTGIVNECYKKITHIYLNAEITEKDSYAIIKQCEKIVDSKRYKLGSFES